MYLERTLEEMKMVFRDIPYGIEHTLKVLKNAQDIMAGELLTEDEIELITIVTVLHDIGAVQAQTKYNSMEGKYQEMEGPDVAKEILSKIGYPSNKMDRICYIIGNHHSPDKIDGLDFQIQWEADLLENLPYMDILNDRIELANYINDNFKTSKGRKLAHDLVKM